jgi:hypothetical protein
MGRAKLSKSDELRARAMVDGGESIRSVAKAIGVSDEAVAKRLRASPAPRSRPGKRRPYTAFGEFDESDVALILAVADAGIPGGLTLQARYMEADLCALLEVVREFGSHGEEKAGLADHCGD